MSIPFHPSHPSFGIYQEYAEKAYQTLPKMGNNLRKYVLLSSTIRSFPSKVERAYRQLDKENRASTKGIQYSKLSGQKRAFSTLNNSEPSSASKRK